MSQRQECHPTGPSSKAIRVWTLRILVGLISVAAIAYGARYAFAYGEYGCTNGCWGRSWWCEYSKTLDQTTWYTYGLNVARIGLDKDDLGNSRIPVEPAKTTLYATIVDGYACDCQSKESPQTEGGGGDENWGEITMTTACWGPT